jgi:hypothetical protein
VAEVIFLGPAKYQDIVDIHHDKVVQVFSEEIIQYLPEKYLGHWLARMASRRIQTTHNEYEYMSLVYPCQGWGKIRPIRIRIRIREYSANSNFENNGKIRQIRMRIPT